MPRCKHLFRDARTYRIGSYIAVAKSGDENCSLGDKPAELLRELGCHVLIIVGKSAETSALERDVSSLALAESFAAAIVFDDYISYAESPSAAADCNSVGELVGLYLFNCKV